MEERWLRIIREAGPCDDCFGGDLHRALCGVPQPRWVGPRYWDASPRVVVALINPGGGGSSAEESLAEEADFFRWFYAGGDYEGVRNYYRDRLSEGARWLCWYRDVLGFDHEEVAQINVAWCATRENEYPPWMLRHCHGKHTRRLIAALEPDVVVLSGSAIHSFGQDIEQAVRGVRVIRMLHYAHRKSKAVEAEEARRVKAEIGRAR